MNGTNVMEIKVAKRDGTHQTFDLDKGNIKGAYGVGFSSSIIF